MAHRFATNRGRGDRYGNDHRRARRDAAGRHHPGDPCARCRHPLGPMGPWLHYDHDEHGGYLGFSHGSRPCPVCGRKCNERAGQVKGAQVVNARRRRERPRPRLPIGW